MQIINLTCIMYDILIFMYDIFFHNWIQNLKRSEVTFLHYLMVSGGQIREHPVYVYYTKSPAVSLTCILSVSDPCYLCYRPIEGTTKGA